MAEIKIIVTGDIHLGIHPPGIPGNLDSDDFSPGHIWKKIVKTALRLQVDALVISGDIVDRHNRFYEAWGPFENGLKDLQAADVQVYMVAGNHDAEVLENFISSMETKNCKLLGAGGIWERASLKTGETVINFDGWSYPTRHVTTSPLEDYNLEPQGITFGLLHTELDRPGSFYAPVTLEKLQRGPQAGWFLGHAHAPRCYSTQPLVLNPGSPQPLNPTETGIHGPWLVTVRSADSIEARQLPLASLRYLAVELDVSSLETPQQLPGLLKKKVEEELDKPESEHGELELISVRLTLTGRSNFYSELRLEAKNIREELQIEVKNIPLHVEKIINSVRPALDLDELAGDNSPVGVLADLILRLEGRRSESLPEDLLDNLQSALGEAYSANTYAPLRVYNDLQSPDLSYGKEFLARAARSLLDELVSQKEEGG